MEAEAGILPVTRSYTKAEESEMKYKSVSDGFTQWMHYQSLVFDAFNEYDVTVQKRAETLMSKAYARGVKDARLGRHRDVTLKKDTQ